MGHSSHIRPGHKDSFRNGTVFSGICHTEWTVTVQGVATELSLQNQSNTPLKGVWNDSVSQE
jgi:hypothetical protein